MREATGLSLAALAARTPYSKSSWERYLNGKTPVPRPAVEALCAMAMEPPERLLALWELADAAWSGRAAPPEPAERAEPAGREPAPGRGGPATATPVMPANAAKRTALDGRRCLALPETLLE
ncbi:helix-turn-helix domain-containing protein, partial [Streptomyces sp. NPDC006307]|uniref:helix-turn-helix domain-containing protein n=1 Tax=Streptomyces sp. NPDC006307 TaxID=3156748 RepID=UPI0033BD975F